MTHANLSELREELELAVLPMERLPLLDELSRLANPIEGKRYAREFLKLASSLHHSKWSVKAYIYLARHEMTLMEYRHACRHLEKAEQLLKEKSSCISEHAQLFRSWGYLWYRYTGDLATAEEHFRRSLEYARKAGSPLEIIQSLYSLGEMYAHNFQIEESLRVLQECLEVCEAKSFHTEAAEVRTLLAMLSIQAEDWRSAQQGLETGLAHFRRVECTAGEARVYQKLGYFYTSQGKFERALEWYEKSTRLFRQLEHRESYIMGVLEVGHVYAEMGKTYQALHCIEEVMAYGEKSGSPMIQALGLIEKGAIYIADNEAERGIEALTSAYTMFEKAGAEMHGYRVMRILASVYEERGQMKEALHCCRKMMAYEKNVASISAREPILAFPLRHELRHMEEEREEVRLQKEAWEKKKETCIKELTSGSLHMAKSARLLERLRKQLLVMKHTGCETVSNLNSLIHEIDACTIHNDDRAMFRDRLERLDSTFAHELSARFESLTPAEVRLCSLLKEQKSSEEIAELLNISRRTVDKHRGNIRRKMGLRSEEHLEEVLNLL